MIVIADDITGAAEIAGIAFSQGYDVRFVLDDGGGSHSSSLIPPPSSHITTIIATDTRSMTEADAVTETRQLKIHNRDGSLCVLFKKTDSALRGHVVPELLALMATTGYQRAVYMPANPSKGRIIRKGNYYINDIPIAETAFSYDPEFPARTSVLKERFPDAEAKNILMPNAESETDIRHIIATYDDGKTLFAGAADLFSAWLNEKRKVDGRGRKEITMCTGTILTPPSSDFTLILCGSTQSKPQELGIPICEMPHEVYDGLQGADYWLNHLSLLPPPSSLLLSIPFTHRTGKAAAVHLRTVMAEMAKRLVITHYHGQRLSLIIEGGATAWATLQALGWTQFDIVRQLAPGVVQMRADNGTLITLKPGSYPWGNMT